MREIIMRPELAGRSFGGYPTIDFESRLVRGKRRLIGIPNRPMRSLHQHFDQFLRAVIRKLDSTGYGVRKLPSAFGCVKKSNPLRNAAQHRMGKYFYITDLTDAYHTVSLPRLAMLQTLLIHAEECADEFSLMHFGQNDQASRLECHPSYQPILDFLRAYFSGQHDTGLAIGGPLSPYLMNLYCEVYIDAPLRRLCEPRRITYTRYVDDLVFSSESLIGAETRRRIRRIIESGGFTVNRRKSKVQAIAIGQVSITQIGLAFEGEGMPARYVFSQRKRRKLHGIIHSYLTYGMDWPEKVSGYVAEFLYYYKNVAVKTATDRKTFELCKRFQAEWARYGGPKWKK